jgi:hypothetical protein
MWFCVEFASEAGSEAGSALSRYGVGENKYKRRREKVGDFIDVRAH